MTVARFRAALPPGWRTYEEYKRAWEAARPHKPRFLEIPETPYPQLVRDLRLLHRLYDDPRFLAALQAIDDRRIIVLDRHGRQRWGRHELFGELIDIKCYKQAEEYHRRHRQAGVSERQAYARVVAEYIYTERVERDDGRLELRQQGEPGLRGGPSRAASSA